MSASIPADLAAAVRAVLDQELEDRGAQEAVLPYPFGGARKEMQRRVLGRGELIGNGSPAVEPQEEALERLRGECGGEEAVEPIILVRGWLDVAHRVASTYHEGAFEPPRIERRDCDRRTQARPRRVCRVELCA